MDHREVLTDGAQRAVEMAHNVLAGIDAATLTTMPGGTGNSIAWLVWHAARQMDVQIADLSGGATVWESGGWSQRLGVERGPDEFGLGDSPEQVAALRVDDPAGLEEHLATCVAAFTSYVDGLSGEDLDEVIDDSWDPPTTRGVRLVSIINDASAHLGQAAYARGLIEGWSVGV